MPSASARCRRKDCCVSRVRCRLRRSILHLCCRPFGRCIRNLAFRSQRQIGIPTLSKQESMSRSGPASRNRIPTSSSAASDRCAASSPPRQRACRFGKGPAAEQVAEVLGVSREVVWRTAHKGREAISRLHTILERSGISVLTPYLPHARVFGTQSDADRLQDLR